MVPPVALASRHRSVPDCRWCRRSSHVSWRRAESRGTRADMKLREICHARSGDKGSIVNIGVIAYHDRDYDRLVQHVTPQRVKQHFSGLVTGEVVRYELPTLAALNFVLYGVVGGGVTQTLALDAHGKAFSSALL